MALTRCPRANGWRPSCKRRTCEACGPGWARDWRRVMEENLGAYGGPVVLVSITPPGADRLPWDETLCTRKGKPGQPHRHSGKRGCRVRQRAAREWTETASWRWSMLRKAAQERVFAALGVRAPILERVWELQKRGVPHLHLVVGYGSELDVGAAHAFSEALAALAPRYDFGFVDRKLKPISAKEAARYLASYLLGRSRHKPSIRELLDDPAIDALIHLERLDASKVSRKISLPLVWVAPRLTRATFVTMRTLRRARHLWAALERGCELPRWSTVVEALKVGVVYRRLYRSRDGPEGPTVGDYELLWARQLDSQINWLERQEWAHGALRFALGSA